MAVNCDESVLSTVQADCKPPSSCHRSTVKAFEHLTIPVETCAADSQHSGVQGLAGRALAVGMPYAVFVGPLSNNCNFALPF